VHLNRPVWEQRGYIRIIQALNTRSTPGGKGRDGLTNSFGIASPLQGASDRVSVPCDEYPKRTRTRPREDQQLVFTDDLDDGLYFERRVVHGLAEGQKLEQGGLVEVDHAVKVIISVAQNVAYALAGQSRRRVGRKRDFLGRQKARLVEAWRRMKN